MKNPFLQTTRLAFLAVFLGGVLTAQANPVISKLNPPTLTERVGDHVAYAATASGTGTLTYQWSFGSAVLAGQITNTLILTNIQTTNAGTYWVRVGDSSGNFVSNSVTLNVSANYLPYYPSNLVVLRVGDGAQTLTTNGNTIYLDQYGTNGTYVSTIQIPDEAIGQPYGTGLKGTTTSGSTAGSPALLMQGIGGDVANAGYLTLAGNNQCLCMIGYCLPYPYSYTGQDVSYEASATYFWRGCATVNTFGYYTLPYTNYGFDSATPHTVESMASPNGVSTFFATGQGTSQSVKWALSTTASGTIDYCTSSAAGSRLVQILNNGNLAFSDTTNIFMISPAPTTYGDVTTPAALLVEGSQPTDFAFSPDYLTLYIADSAKFTGTGNKAGGIERWDTTTPLSGYAFSYTLQPLPGASTNGAQGLAVYFPPTVPSWGTGQVGAVVYATTTGLTNTSPTNSLVQIIDNGASSTSTVLVTAGTNQYLHGLRFVPTAVGTTPVTFNSQPVSETAYDDGIATFSVSASGYQPIYYQWESNGVAIAGATSSTLVLTNVQYSYAASYSVVVSNQVPSSLTSTSAVLTVLSGAPIIVVPAQSRVETVGDHLAFSVTAGGAPTLSYQWYFGANAIPGATNLYVVVSNAQVTNSGSYSVIVTNSLGKITNSATLLITPGLQPLSSTNLVMSRIGDGSQTLSYATGNTVYLDQYTPAGAYVNTIQIPDTLPNALLLSGSNSDAIYEGFLTLSANSNYLNLGGFNAAFPATTSVGATTRPRSIAAIDASGSFILAATNAGIYTGTYNGTSQFHSVVSSDGLTNFWTAGSSTANGVKWIQVGPNSGSGEYDGISSAISTCHVLSIDPLGNVAFTASTAAGYTGLNVYSGYPEMTTARSSQVVNVGPTASPEDFAISPDYTTIYLADDSGTSSAGIERWDLVGGTWVNSYTLATGASLGASGLTVNFSAQSSWGQGVTGAILYATTAGASNNSLITIVDNGSNSTPTIMALAGPNQILRGLRFGPVGAPPSIAAGPQVQEVISNGTAHFSVAASYAPPITYQWQFDGTNIAGATGSSLTVPDAGSNNLGSYTVVVGNNFGSVTSTPVSLTLTAPATAPYPLAVLNDNPTAFWRLDNTSGSTALDIAGGFDGTYTPAVELGVLPGYNSTTDPNEPTAYFFGNGSGAQVGTPLDLATNGYAEFSVEVWINTLASDTSGGIIGLDSPSSEFYLDCSSTNAAGGLSFAVEAASPVTLNAINSAYVPDANWHYVVGVCDQSNSLISLYVDGVLMATNTFAGTGISEPAANNDDDAPPAGSPLYSLDFPHVGMIIGGKDAGADQFSGEISQVAVYSYALSSNQVLDHYLAAGIPPSFIQAPPATQWGDAGGSTTLSAAIYACTPPISYLWFSNGVAVAQTTNATLTLTGLSGEGASSAYTYTLVVSNEYGMIQGSTELTVYAGAPQLVTDIQPSAQTALLGLPTGFSAAFGGTAPLAYQWQFNGMNLTNNTRISGSQTPALTIADAQSSDAGSYQLVASNAFGTNVSSIAVLSVTNINFNNGVDWSTNSAAITGNGDTFSGNVLYLTDGGAAIPPYYDGEELSAFLSEPVPIAAFTASWTYQDVSGTDDGDGYTFVVQNDPRGPTALGQPDADDGFDGITNSIGLEFNIDSLYVPPAGIGLFTDGYISDGYGPYYATGAVNLTSGDPIGVVLVYNGQILNVTLTDDVTSASYSTNYTISIPSIVGSANAYVGFTASAQYGPSIQQVSDFYFSGSANFGPIFLQLPATLTADAGQNVSISASFGSFPPTPPVSYQWYSNDIPLSWATNATVVLTNVSGPDTYTYTLAVTNDYGSNQASTMLTVYAGAPQIISDIQPLSATAGVGGTQVFSAIIGGTYPISLQWQFNGSNLVDGSYVSGSHSNILTLSDLQFGEAGNYQLIASNSFGTNATSVASLSVVSLSFEAPTSWTVNSNGNIGAIGGTFSGNTLTLTDNGGNQTVSAFWNTPEFIGNFVATWTYQETGSSPADGTAFVLQNSSSGPSALGGPYGGDIGYIGLTNSVALEFNIYSGNTVGMALGTDGNGVDVGTSSSHAGPYTPTTPVNLASGDPIGVTVVYVGGVMSVTLTDAVANVSYATNYAVNIPALVTSNTAYVGFTSADGGAVSIQVVSNFTYINIPTLTAQKGSGGTLILTWPAGESAVLQQSSSLTGNWVTTNVTPTVVNGNDQVTVTNSGTTQFYRLSVPIP